MNVRLKSRGRPSTLRSEERCVAVLAESSGRMRRRFPSRPQTSPTTIFLCFSRNKCVSRSERLTRAEEYAILISSFDEEIREAPDRIAKRKLPRTAERGVWQRLRPACRELLPVAAGGSLDGRPCAPSELSLPSVATAVKKGASSCYSQSSVSRRDTPNARMSP